MLVLSRKVNETIIINDNIVITVVDIRGDKVRLELKLQRTFPFIAKRCTTRSSGPKALAAASG